MFRNVVSNVFSTIGVLVMVSLISSATIWYLGPLIVFGDIRPLDRQIHRLIAITMVIAATTIAILVVLLRRHLAEQKMTDAITAEAAAPADQTDAAVTAELAEMRGRMSDALKFLRKSRLGGRFGSRHLYQLPWYIIIGPPGAGKTTAIANSGLRFPLAERMGKAPVGGVGGTRNCDWWFTDEAVLLDTAGRYTTQDSNRDADMKAWTGFLDMLKQHRKRQPINGAVVAISLSDLSLLDDAAQRAHAHAIRTRLHELREKLGVRFPVYVLFTKADLIAGFQEFFADLGEEERKQVWGFTLPDLKSDCAQPARATFEAEFDTLLTRLSDRSLERMQSETDYQRRSLIAGFPAQIASLRGVADAFLGEMFQDSRYEESQFLRGIYFTSGTQEGTPIDRLMMGMSRTFGIGRQAIGTGKGQGRSYFLTRLLTGVIFREAGLVSADDAIERRFRWIRRGAVASGILTFSAAAAVWTNSFVGNARLIETARAEVNTFREIAAEVPRNPVADADLPAVVPALNILRDLPGNPAASDPEPPVELTFGLYQGDAIGTETAQAYRGALNTLLLPRLLFRLEEQMQASMNNPDFLFEALKVYLMLGLQGPMDEATVKQWMQLDWAVAFEGQDQTQIDLQGHLDALINGPMREIALNGPLVDQIQGLLSQTPLAERIYQSIVTAPPARDLTPFRITDVGGPAVSRVLLRPSGQPLSAGIDGVYTRAGFHEYFLPQLADVADRVQFENLVLGDRVAEVTPDGLDRLARDVLALYETDFVTEYEQLLADIDIIPMDSVGQAAQVTNVLSGPTSPIRNILEAVSEETRLTQLPQNQAILENAGDSALGLARDEVVSALDAQGLSILEALGSILPADGSDAAAIAPGQFVEDSFAAIHDLVARADGGPSELDDLIGTVTDVFDELNRLSLGQNTGTAIAGQGANAAANLQAEIARLPDPLQRWATQIAAGSSGAAVGGARAELNAKWRSQVLPFCTRAIDGRYPFNRQAQADVALQDFGRLFAPSGLIDTFFNENLASFVDTTTNPWRLRRVNGVDIGISDAVIAQFQKASEIRDSFFLSPGLPSITFDVTPVALDPDVEQVVVEIEGQQVSYAHGPPQVTPLTWPGQPGGRTRVAFAPARSDVENAIQRDGPWAWFRLLDAAELRRTNVSDRNRMIFNLGGRIAIFQLRAGSALNPFTVSALGNFSCPASL